MEKSMKPAVPGYMVSATALTGPVEVTSSPQLAMKDGKPKLNAAFPGRQAYRVGVEWMRGIREKVMPSGEAVTAPILEQTVVTVWTDHVLSAEVGSYVRLQSVMIGGVDGSTYVQALGLEPVEASS